jgi:hypothetical protein
LSYNTSFVRRCFQAVTADRNGQAKITADPLINFVRDFLYVPCRPLNLPWTDVANLGQIMSSTARMYVTNCQNHVTTNLEHRLKTWIKHKLERVPYANDDEVKKAVHHVYTLILNGEDFQAPRWLLESDLYDVYMKSFYISRMEYVWERAGWDIMEGLRYVC